MIKSKILISVAFLLIALGTAAKPVIPIMLYPSHDDQAKMLNEADDFIDDMADGLQDHQADAIYHAMKGVGSELAAVRHSRNGKSEASKGVVRKDINGDGSARGLEMRLYKPSAKTQKALPLLVYFHGGGWTFGSIESCAHFCDALAATGNVMVLAVNYSLAPEKPFPSGLNDCEGAIEYAVAHASEWGSDPSLVSVGGDSAGGNLALASAMELIKNKSLPKGLRSIVLVYPVVKAYNDGSASWKKYSRGYGLDGRLMEAFNEAYVSSGTSAKDPRVSPAHASDADLKKLPPVLMISAQRDILYDQGKEFAGRLKKLGNNVEWVEFPGAIHLFATVNGQPMAFSKAVTLTSQFLKQ